MRTVKQTPKTMYLYNPYFDVWVEIIKPMPRFKRWLWRMLGFEYREEFVVCTRDELVGLIDKVFPLKED